MVLPEYSQDERAGTLDHCTKCEIVQTTKCTEKSFLKSVSVWINKPHVVNRRLCGSKIVHLFRGPSQEEASDEVEKYRCIYKNNGEATTRDTNLHFSDFTDLFDEKEDFTVIVRELIPKSEFFPKLLEAVVYDKHRSRVSFIPVDQDCKGKQEDLRPTAELQYHIELRNGDDSFPEWAQANEIKLSWSCDHDERQIPRRQLTSQWLKTTLLDKLVNWSQVRDISTSVTSLQLVDVDSYKNTYIRLKNTYGRELVKNWTERTDPEKFVYEDVAIAAYLLLIWEEDRKTKNLLHKQSFVDLGCGNGLLVYILTKEGHKGLGIDLRKRNIWDTFGPDINLQEEAISPSGDHLYTGYDWIIGNHSDELTPWIPVIAARSSYETSFFLLPCCPHDFVGKFTLTEMGKGRYGSYIDYLKDIVTHCGFKPEQDTLRIPSTRRICFIGRKRTYEQKDECEMDIRRQSFIDKRTVYIRDHVSQKLSLPESKTGSDDVKISMNKLAGLFTSRNVSKVGNHAEVAATCITQPAPNCHSAADCLDGVCLNSAASNITDNEGLSITAGDKRKVENLGSADSGFCDMDSGDDFLSPKRYRSSTSTDESVDSQKSDEAIKLSCEAGETQDVKSEQWVKGFQPRVDPGIRNCQTVPDHVKSKIVKEVFQLVLAAPDCRCVSLSDGRTWTKGGTILLSQAATLFDKCTMQNLKSECGGLQTLLRNHSHIFQVTNGRVQLRDFTAADPWLGCNAKKNKNKRDKQQDNRKTTLCWFDANHPDGCPKTTEECQFAHGIEELREKLVRGKIG